MKTKICARCKEIKNITEFGIDRKTKCGLNCYCKECIKLFRKERKLKYPNYAQEYREKNKDILKIRRKESYKKSKIKNREYQLFKRFGITLEQYNQMLEEQNGVCAICGQPDAIKNKNLAVDHNHVTNKIRGLLCGRCNQTIGLVNEDITILLKSVEYLNRFK